VRKSKRWKSWLVKRRFTDFSLKKTRGFFTYALAPFLTNINFIHRTYTFYTYRNKYSIRTCWVHMKAICTLYTQRKKNAGMDLQSKWLKFGWCFLQLSTKEDRGRWIHSHRTEAKNHNVFYFISKIASAEQCWIKKKLWGLYRNRRNRVQLCVYVYFPIQTGTHRKL